MRCRLLCVTFQTTQSSITLVPIESQATLESMYNHNRTTTDLEYSAACDTIKILDVLCTSISTCIHSIQHCRTRRIYEKTCLIVAKILDVLCVPRFPHASLHSIQLCGTRRKYEKTCVIIVVVTTFTRWQRKLVAIEYHLQDFHYFVERESNVRIVG